MKVCEIFHSIQGEGEFLGYPTIFIRLTGCNLRCRYCDTQYALYEGEDIDVDEIMKRIESFKSRYVCVTGGEPLLQEETFNLIETLLKHERGYMVLLETNGSIGLKKVIDTFDEYGERFTISMDIKTPSSGMEDKMLFDNISLLRTHDQLKFVVGDENDYFYSKQVISRYKPKCKIVIQPVWGTDYRKIADLMIEDGIDARLSLQIHKIIWGEDRGH
ncbi:MAG: radical SAM protein [Thermoplasmata archaeon]|nr:MAG: radical SAM protein [Thermoplasmata archaeon]KAA0017355.1 MAG: radical SAM protein [Thermoplasmata archaeon]